MSECVRFGENNSSVQNLRDRIAVVVSDALEKWLQSRIDPNVRYDVEYIITDAVIAELQLDVEDGECNYCHAMLPGCRYSTWKADDE